MLKLQMRQATVGIADERNSMPVQPGRAALLTLLRDKARTIAGP